MESSTYRFVLLALVMTVIFSDAATTPNIVLIMADDLGYGDLGCFGNTTLSTPHLDQLAAEGVKLTHSIAADTLCTPSRAAFLTGRYPIRSGMASSSFIRAFMFTASAAGLPTSETTIAEVAKRAGYKTAFLGKWHQGWSLDRWDPNHHHPLNQGFDYFYGIPLTNMPDFGDLGTPWVIRFFPHLPFQLLTTFLLVLLPVACLVRAKYLSAWLAVLVVTMAALSCGSVYFIAFNMKLLNSFMFRDYTLVEQPVELCSVTRKLVAESEDFVQARHRDQQPFLLLLSWLHVHAALCTAPSFRGRSAHGLYGDAVSEMDWGVGRVMQALDQYGMTHNTFVYFTSDHGGAPKLKNKMGMTVGGFNGPFTGGKTEGSTEGSFRVPGIMRWPAGLAAGQVVSEPVSLMDVLPTVAQLLDVPPSSSSSSSPDAVTPDLASPSQVTLDGASLLPLLTGQDKVSPHDFLFHYCQDSVHAVRYRPRTGDHIWKLMLREPNPGKKEPTKGCDNAVHLNPYKLYDLSSDPIATLTLDVQEHAKVVAVMLKALRDHEESVAPVPSQFTMSRLMWRPWEQPCCNFPACACQDDKFKGMFLD